MITAHADVVGGLLRPPELLEAKEDVAAGKISQAEFKAIEDWAVDEAITLQENAGLELLTDGEMRRPVWKSHLPSGVEEFGQWNLDAFWPDNQAGGDQNGEGKGASPAPPGVTGLLRRQRQLVVEEFVYLRAKTKRIPKITLPSPSLWVNFWPAEQEKGVYSTLDNFLAEIVAVVQDTVRELVRLGAVYIQLNAPHYALLLQPQTRAFFETQGWTLESYLEQGIELDNAVMGETGEVTFGYHLCQGNQSSRWLVGQEYDLIAAPIFEQIEAQRLLLEYGAEGAGSFEPLRRIPEDKMAVLGLVTTSAARRETVEDLAAQIKKASQYISVERLALGPQCGFSNSAGDDALTLEDERYKLNVIVTTARQVWG